MALLDIPVVIGLALITALPVIYLVIVRFRSDYLEKSVPNIDTIKAIYLREIELGIEDVSRKRPDTQPDENGCLPIIDFEPLRDSLSMMEVKIKSYRFWSNFLSNAKNKLNHAAPFIVLTIVFGALYNYTSDLVPPFMLVTIMSQAYPVTIKDIIGSLTLLFMIPFLYSVGWILYKHSKIDSELGRARKQAREEAENEESSKTKRQRRKRKNSGD